MYLPKCVETFQAGVKIFFFAKKFFRRKAAQECSDAIFFRIGSARCHLNFMRKCAHDFGVDIFGQ